MLLFIRPANLSFTLSTKFQYISCYCLSVSARIYYFSKSVFQYISCYCLSNYVNYYSYNDYYFNTSHVTVYHSGLDFACDFPLFQYISCYCLSMPWFWSKEKYPLFQYISCYCLSAIRSPFSITVSHFNTSHVTVYLLFCLYRKIQKCHFNTSHVTVYRHCV